MIYGARHSDKCSDKELKQFKEDVFTFLCQLRTIKGLQFNWKTIRSFNSYGGYVRVYTGKINERMSFRRRRRLVAYKDVDGQIIGKTEEDKQELETRKADKLFEYHSEPIKEVEYFSVFRVDWYHKDKEIADNEKEQLKLFLEANK